MASAFDRRLSQAEGLEEDGFKHRVGSFLESHTMEAIIFLLIIADIVLVTIEMGVDHHLFCVSGQRVDASPSDLAAFAAAHGTAVAGLLQDAAGTAQAATAASAALVEGLAMAAALVAPSTVQVSLLRSGASLLPPAPPPARGAVLLDQAHAAHHTLRRRLPHTELAGSAALTGLHPRVAPDAHQGAPHGDAAAHGGAHDGAPHDAHGAPEAHGAHGEAHGHGGGEAHGAHGGHGEAHGHGPAGALVCEDRNGPHAHHLTHTCHTWSVIILFCFAIELSLKFWVHPKEFMSNPFHMLDLFIVVASILVDTVVTWMIESWKKDGTSSREVEYAALLLILLRLWRIVRIVHGLMEVCVGEEKKEELEHMLSKKEHHSE